MRAGNKLWFVKALSFIVLTICGKLCSHVPLSWIAKTVCYYFNFELSDECTNELTNQKQYIFMLCFFKRRPTVSTIPRFSHIPHTFNCSNTLLAVFFSAVYRTGREAGLLSFSLCCSRSITTPRSRSRTMYLFIARTQPHTHLYTVWVCVPSLHTHI